jgi:hypothetical protein
MIDLPKILCYSLLHRICVYGGKGVSDLHRAVGKFIWKLGCPNKYDGYRYTLDSVCIALQSGEVLCLRKSIYEELARKYKTDTRNIERCIRHFICKWWAQHQCANLFSKRPTNSELICHLVEYIRLEIGVCKACLENGLVACDCTQQGVQKA